MHKTIKLFLVSVSIILLLSSTSANKIIGVWTAVDKKDLITLTITDDGKCIGTENEINGKPKDAQHGTWSSNDDGSITLVFKEVKLNAFLVTSGKEQVLRVNKVSTKRYLDLKRK